MALDAANYISGLSPVDPPFNDPMGEADDHIRTVKRATKQSFPNIDAAVNATPSELNTLVGITSSVAELNYVLDAAAKQLFIQASAPTGWTIDATFDDRALKIDSTAGGSTGGTYAFSTIFQDSTWDTTTVAGHDHGGSTGPANGDFGGIGLSNDGNSVAHDHPISSDGGHNHTSDMRVQYAVGVVCSKDAY